MPSPPTSLLKTWWRRLYWLRRDSSRLGRLPWRSTAFFLGVGGIGDELLVTGLIHAWHAQTGRRVDVHARHPALFWNNPGVRRIFPAEPALLETAATWHADLRRPSEWQRNFDEDRQVPPTGHIITEAARAGGFRGRLQVRPHLWLSPAERTAAPAAGCLTIAIQSSGASARYFFRNKEWGHERFQEVVRKLGTHARFIQLGAKDDPLLEGALDRRGLPDLRQSAALLASCQLFIGQVGFLMHLARAVECRSVIVYGGRELPAQSGYPCNENLTESPPCSPCWQQNRCSHERICLTRITPAAVVEGVARLVPRLGLPLETEEAVL